MKRWTFTSRRIGPKRITLGIAFAWYDGSHKGITGFSVALNLLWWYIDIGYRRRPNEAN